MTACGRGPASGDRLGFVVAADSAAGSERPRHHDFGALGSVTLQGPGLAPVTPCDYLQGPGLAPVTPCDYRAATIT